MSTGREDRRAKTAARWSGPAGETRYGPDVSMPYGRSGSRTTEAAAAIKRRNQIRAAEFRAALRRQEGR